MASSSSPDTSEPFGPLAALRGDGPALSRRHLLRGLGIGGALIVGGPTLLSGCGTAEKAQGSAASNAPITVSYLNEPPALDPIKYNLSTIESVYRQVVEQLYEWTEDKSVAPLLAAKLPEISADGLTYTIALRQNVTFHNGKAFDSGDVKYTIEQIQKAQNASVWRSGAAFIKSVEAPDSHTVKIVLNQVYTPFLGKLALWPVVPSNVPYDTKIYTRNLIGTGPFKFSKWEQGKEIVLTRNSTYWEAGLPYADSLTFQFASAETSRVTAIAGGSVQMVNALQAQSTIALAKRPGVKLHVLGNSSQNIFMYPNVQPGRPTADVKLRQAIAWAVDREAIISQVFKGYAVACCTKPGPAAKYYDKTIGQSIQLDLDKAKSYLQAAGGAPSRPLELALLSTANTPVVAAIVQDNLKKIGIAVNIRSLQVAAGIHALINMDYDLFMLDVLAQEGVGFGQDEAYLAVASAFSNLNKFKDEQLYDQTTQAVTLKDGPEAESAWRAVQQRWTEVLPQINLTTARLIVATNGLETTPSSMGDLHDLKRAHRI